MYAIKQAEIFVDLTAKARSEQENTGKAFLLEHPEAFGYTANGAGSASILAATQFPKPCGQNGSRLGSIA